MKHDLKAQQPHTVLTLKLAFHSSDVNDIAGGVNQLLGPEINEGWLADYALCDNELPTIVTASSKPEAGELFNQVKCYSICVQDSDYNTDWYKITTELQLDEMNELELIEAIGDKIIISNEARVYVGCVNTMQNITL